MTGEDGKSGLKTSMSKMNSAYITVRQEDKRKTTEMIHEWSNGEHAEVVVTEEGEMEADVQLWGLLKGAAKRRQFNKT